MAFASTITSQNSMGNKRANFGTFTNGTSDEGGDIDTGLTICEMIVLQSVDTAVIASATVANETLPVAGTAVTVVCTASEDGNWIAWGY